MSISDAKELKKMLRIIVEESTRNAYDRAYEDERKYQQRMSKELNEEDPLFPDEDDEGGDKEGGEEEPEVPGDEMDKEPAPDQAEPAPAPKEDKPQKQYKTLPLVLEPGKVTFDSIISTLNLVRGARSFKDPNVGAQLRKYFESLSEPEKLAYATFLAATKDIAVGESADQAQDPSDPSTNLTITTKEKGQNIQQQSQQQPQQQVQQQPQQQVQQVQTTGQQAQTKRQSAGSEELEDTDAPIVVGKRNESLDVEFRNKIREIIKKNSVI